MLATETRVGTTRVAIVGAGPYGLSIAAYLRGMGIAHRIFGVPMETWRMHMPGQMSLKSEGFASSLYDPDDWFTLGRFCKERGIPYADVGIPVTRSIFADYGMAFAARYVPDLDTRRVVEVTRASTGFVVTVEGGERILAERVIVAAGISHYPWLPPALSGVSERYVTHASAHHDLQRFAGQTVAVVGSGASAVDMAACLHQASARTKLVARAKRLKFHDPPQVKRSLYRRLRQPQSGLGPNIKSYLFSNFPDAFAAFPARARALAVRKALGPSACWFTKDLIVGKVDTVLGVSPVGVEIVDDRAVLHLEDARGVPSTLACDHVIAGTGYRVAIDRLDFLPADVAVDVRQEFGSPVLSRNFESTVPGLYFVGVSAAQTFGPLLRFAFGARFAARRITTHFARVLERGAATVA